MKIGIVTTWKQKCGIATYSSYLASELKNNSEVIILAERKDVLPQGVDPNFEDSGVPSIECWSRAESFDNLLSVIKQSNIDIVHIQHQFGLFPNPIFQEQLLRGIKELGKKLIITLHDVVPFDPNYSSYFAPLFRYADKIIVHNQDSKSVLVNSWKCPPEKIVHIWHGTKLVDMPPQDDSRIKLNINQDAKVIMSWGFLWESKGVLQMLEILKEVKKTYPKAIFIHAGGLHPIIEGKQYLQKIYQEAVKFGFSPKEVRITGFVPEKDVPTFFAASDLIILNYMRGSLSASGAAHRALASHKPIVGTDDPCISEIPKQTYARFDQTGLYQAIMKVLGDETLRKTLVEKSDAFAIESSWKNVSIKHMEVYGGEN
jgi:glycosyltransferase involved in cell wall biosynthesis